ncbi:hypothetical protein XENOCAPTIV_023109 [Xenoophorus captivus]|uniref:Uncharacterized protein n=1 Tax=Xenoophorus captivus TaxID=1517983 RepID=A0ABV0RD78_9TELE
MRGRFVIGINTLRTLVVRCCSGSVVTSNESPYIPLGRTSIGRGIWAQYRVLVAPPVLKANLGAVILKTLVYQRLQVLLCTFTNQEAPNIKCSLQGSSVTDWTNV